MMSYKEAIEEFGTEVAAALLEEEYNQFVRGVERVPADFIPFDDAIEGDNYIDFIETIGADKYEKLYRMEEEF